VIALKFIIIPIFGFFAVPGYVDEVGGLDEVA
jgi:hypothetical protein